MRADEESPAPPKPINGHDHSPAEKDKAAAEAPKFVRQVVLVSRALPPKLIYLLDGQYVGEIAYTAFTPDVLLAIAEDFARFAKESIDAAKKPRIARPGPDAAELLRAAR